MFFGDDIPLDNLLFVTSRGSKLPKLQNYPGKGSLLNVFGTVVEIDQFNLKMLRKMVEGHIQSSSELQQDTKGLNSHSSQVAKKVYDQMVGPRRNVLLTNLSKQDGITSMSGESEISDALKKEREEREANLKKKLIEKAERYLADLKKIQPWDERPSAINQDEVFLLKSIFGNEANGMHYYLNIEMHYINIFFIFFRMRFC